MKIKSILAIVVVSSLLVFFMVWVFSRVDTINGNFDRCRQVGGEPVRGRAGPTVCIDRSAIIPEEEWAE